jgi:hypothetical protein
VVDAGVAGDLVDPRLERDLPIGGAKVAERGDEHFLDDVLGASMVMDDVAHVRRDPVAVAAEKNLECLVATVARSRDELLVRGAGDRGRRSQHHWFQIESTTAKGTPPGRHSLKRRSACILFYPPDDIPNPSLTAGRAGRSRPRQGCRSGGNRSRAGRPADRAVAP